MLAWAGVITILAAAPQVYDQTLRRAPGSLWMAEATFVIALSALIGVISVGVVRRWHWIFWAILAVFLGCCPCQWAVIHFTIALMMLADYRRSGAWGPF